MIVVRRLDRATDERAKPITESSTIPPMASSIRFGVAAICGVMVLVVLDLLVVGDLTEASRLWYVATLRIVLYSLATILAGLAAAQFGWLSQHLGRAWTLFSLEFLLLLVNYIVRRTAPDADLALDLSVIGANGVQVAAYWLMARSLNAAGIGYLTSQSKRILLTLLALAVAVLLCYSSLLAEWQSIRAGDVRIGSIVSVVSDVITFTLIAPLAMSAFALRGGQLFWIFGYLTLAVFGWMLNQSASALTEYFLVGDDPLRTIRGAGVAIATLFTAAAAATQWLAARRTMEGAGIDA